jgi:DNA-binding NarL/FixJ family response regulator
MINILVVDPHPIIRTGLKSIFNSVADMNVVGCVGNGIQIFEFVRRNDVNIIISEIDLPELNGITALRAIKKEHKAIKVIMFSNQPEEIYAISTITAEHLDTFLKMLILTLLLMVLEKLIMAKFT